MAVITISRQFGSGGDEIANRVCEALGYRQFDKRLIAQVAREAGLSEQEIIDYNEESHKVLGFFDRLFGRSATAVEVRVWKEDVSGVRRPEEFRLSEESALMLVQKAIQQAHKMGNVVILGRGGQVLLKDQPDVLHVRIEASMEERVQRVKERLKESRQEFLADIDIRREAQDLIYLRDGASQDYIRRFYNADWDDSTLYHVVINTSKLTVDQSVQLILGLVAEIEKKVDQPKENVG